MEKGMWRLKTYEIPSSWQQIIQHGEELPWAAPRKFPLCVHAGNKKKLTKESWRESQAQHHMGTARDRYRCRTLPFSALGCAGPIWVHSSVKGITAGSWDCAAPPAAGQRSVPRAELQKRPEVKLKHQEVSWEPAIRVIPGHREK